VGGCGCGWVGGWVGVGVVGSVGVVYMFHATPHTLPTLQCAMLHMQCLHHGQSGV